MTLAKCHPQRKMQAREMCKGCYDKWLKSVNPKYHSDQLSNAAKWARANPERYKVILKRRSAKLRANPMLRREAMLRKSYGINQAEYERMLETQGGGCALCGRKPKTYLHVDHCHVTQKVRGLLCHQCNWYLGTVEADPTILNRIVLYIGGNLDAFRR